MLITIATIEIIVGLIFAWKSQKFIVSFLGVIVSCLGITSLLLHHLGLLSLWATNVVFIVIFFSTSFFSILHSSKFEFKSSLIFHVIALAFLLAYFSAIYLSAIPFLEIAPVIAIIFLLALHKHYKKDHQLIANFTLALAPMLHLLLFFF